MPGYSAECVSGAHEACADRSCRCDHHSWTQELIAKQKNTKRGKRNQLQVIPSAEPQSGVACPQCKKVSEESDNFCRGCGKALAGKGCERCGQIGKADDAFCFACGWKHGETPPPITLAPPTSKEMAVERLKDLARQRGIPEERVAELLNLKEVNV